MEEAVVIGLAQNPNWSFWLVAQAGVTSMVSPMGHP